MAQPSSPNYPVSYDDADSLLGLPGNREVFTVSGIISVDDIVFQMNEDLTAVNLPCYITFEGGEIVFITSIAGAGSDQFVCTSLAERGVLNTDIQPHGNGERVYVSILSLNHNLMRSAVILAQKYQGRVGLDAAKGTPTAAGEAYVATDTDKIYRCADGATWTQINFRSHGDLANHTSDKHTQYHIDTRADTWHGAQSGIHIAGGDDHDHYSTGEGSACIRVDGGLDANKPTGPANGDVYFATDLDGGTLHVGQGGVWGKIGGVPQGGIMNFDGPCPSGWTRYAPLDDAYPRGNVVTAAGTTGGAWTHTHGYSVIREHYHSIDEVGGVTCVAGTPSTHYDTARTGSISQTDTAGSSWATGGSNVTYGGDHSHSLTVPAHSVENTGLASGAETNAGTNKPASYRTMWCQKD
ncbi:MAG: hypothetical protein KAJ73_05460 [Zetaproteobacteria bacterium]|nr:hypothetical protein [Zetaproteobacteria bacterium]